MSYVAWHQYLSDFVVNIKAVYLSTKIAEDKRAPSI
jgi:hypothetical protein